MIILQLIKGLLMSLTPFKIEDLLKRDQINIDLDKNKKQYLKKLFLLLVQLVQSEVRLLDNF